MIRRGLVVAAAVACVGCTHVQLRKNTIRQAGTLSDIYQQQVLDNLAKFVCDYYSLPHFAFARDGTSQVSDTASATGGANWPGIVLDAFSLELKGERAVQESWMLTPISDPRVLDLMRCAYQRAVAPCLSGAAEPTCCPNCDKRFKQYYTGSSDGHIPLPGSPSDNGVITAECLRTDCCWFRIGCKKCVPKDSSCRHIGHYCGVYVWVPPGRGQDELTKLTLVILDFAFHEAAKESAPMMEEVTYYYNKEGALVPQAEAVTIIKARRPVPGVVALPERVKDEEKRGALRGAPPKEDQDAAPPTVPPGAGELPTRTPRPSPSPFSLLDLRQQLRTVNR